MPKFRWYYIFPAALLYLVALMPMFVVHGLADILRVLFYYVFGYRKKVVFENLRKSFPEKDEQWIEITAWKFYANLLDTIIETLSMARLGRSFYRKRMKYTNLNILEELRDKQQPFILVCGHITNWEWAGQGLHLNGIQTDVLYHPLSNPFFNWYLFWCRTRFGLHVIPMQSTIREMLQRKHIPSAITFIADQTPGPEGCHWMEFLNQDTPVFLGVEKMAKKFNYPVVYGEMYRKGRGYYEIDFIKITDTPNATAEFEITEKHMHLLEDCIRKAPEAWLWSHRRWKHKRPNQSQVK